MLLGACGGGPPPSGGEPALALDASTLLVLPAVDRTGQPATAAALLATIAEPLAERGYYVVPVDVGLELLENVGETADAAERRRRIGEVLGVEACLLVEVAGWSARYSQFLDELEYDVTYTLWRTSDGEQAWQQRAAGTYAYDPDPFQASFFDWEEPFYWHPFTGAAPGPAYRDELAVARALHRGAFARMPRGAAPAPPLR
jgi:hypothetical protein